MTRGRLEAFSDGMIAIFITVMVLEMKIPHGGDWRALGPLVPVFLAYILSYLILGIYWANHHHLLHTVEKVNGKILWANLHLLFWLSLVPVATGWMGHEQLAALPTAVYGGVLLLAALAWKILQRAILTLHGPDSTLAVAVRGDLKGNLSLVIYVAAVAAAFLHPWISAGLYFVVVLMWLVPDRRIETTLEPRH